MKEQVKKALDWLNAHKLVYVLVAILIVLAIYNCVFRPMLEREEKLDIEVTQPGTTSGEQVTKVAVENSSAEESMECYVEYFREDAVLWGEYATGEWQSRVVYRQDGTTQYATNKESDATTIAQNTTAVEDTMNTSSSDTTSEQSTGEGQPITTTQLTTAVQSTIATQGSTSAQSTTTASTAVQSTTSAQKPTSAQPTTTAQENTSVPKTTETSPSQSAGEETDPFMSTGWTKTKEDAYFKYYTNGEWNIEWCFRDYGGGDYDEVMINEYLGNSTEVSVPAYIAEKKVTSLCNTFMDSTIHFKSIQIPATVRELYGTFGRAYYISKIIFEKGSQLSYVDDRAFGGTHKGGDDWDSLTTICCDRKIQNVIVDGYYVQESDFIFQR